VNNGSHDIQHNDTQFIAMHYNNKQNRTLSITAFFQSVLQNILHNKLQNCL
jgi:hypothetical protein